MGEDPGEGGHYITVWAPRQCGKTWIMQQILFRLQENHRFDVLKINLEHLKEENKVPVIIETIAEEIGEGLNKTFTGIKTRAQLQKIFKKGTLAKPLILILDEFDALTEKGIDAIVSAFRNIYPEFPTGNGKIDIVIDYNKKRYGLELKTYSDAGLYNKALIKAAEYGRQLELKEINLVFFIEAIDDENKKKYEAEYQDETTGVKVIPIFVTTGNLPEKEPDKRGKDGK